MQPMHVFNTTMHTNTHAIPRTSHVQPHEPLLAGQWGAQRGAGLAAGAVPGQHAGSSSGSSRALAPGHRHSDGAVHCRAAARSRQQQADEMGQVQPLEQKCKPTHTAYKSAAHALLTWQRLWRAQCRHSKPTHCSDYSAPYYSSTLPVSLTMPATPGDSLPACWPWPRGVMLLFDHGSRAFAPSRLDAVERLLLLLAGLMRPSRRATPPASSSCAVMDSCRRGQWGVLGVLGDADMQGRGSVNSSRR
jgi:hypothetical protein